MESTNNKMNMTELAAVLASKCHITKKEAQKFLTDFVECIKSGVEKDHQVKIKGLGTFKVIGVEARQSVNISTGERVLIEGHQKLTFTPDALMKELVNKPFSHFETVILNSGVDFDDKDTLEKPQETEQPEPEPEPQMPVAEPQEDPETAPQEEPEATTQEAIVAEEPTEEPTPEVAEELAEEPEQQPQEEPEPAPTEEPEPEIPVISEPEVEESEPEIEEKPVALHQEEPAEEPLEDPVAEPETEPVAEQEAEVEQKKTATGDSPLYKWLWLMLAILACIVSFAWGYWFGAKTQMPNAATTETVVEEPIAAEPAEEPAAPASPEAAVAPETSEEPTAETQQVPTAQPAEKSTAPMADWQQYDAKDQRIRLGFYGIVGIKDTVTARSGETLARLSRRILGPDMECYVEAVNNLKATDTLTAGQKIKIPKLVSKKILRKQLEDANN